MVIFDYFYKKFAFAFSFPVKVLLPFNILDFENSSTNVAALLIDHISDFPEVSPKAKYFTFWWRN